MKPPNFFIAGAPRCGTTALYTYLSAHPRIFMPEIKELHYFASDFPHLQKIASRSDADYLKVFEKAADRHLAVGEASPLYIYSRAALPRIRQFNPAARIILILRNPVDFVQSVHQLNLGLLREDEPDLRRAWELQDLRREGRRIPRRCREVELLLYGELGSFGRHVEKVFGLFPRRQVMVLLFDDFVADPRGIYESLLSFLGVPSDGRTSFPQVNANFEIRSMLLARIIHPPQAAYEAAMKFFSLFGVDFKRSLSRLHSRIEELNAVRTRRASLDPALRGELQAYFEEDILKLGGLLDRDLSAWLLPA